MEKNEKECVYTHTHTHTHTCMCECLCVYLNHFAVHLKLTQCCKLYSKKVVTETMQQRLSIR